MQVCGCNGKWCNGLLPKGNPRKVIDGVVYSLQCDTLKEKEDAKKITKPSNKNKYRLHP